MAWYKQTVLLGCCIVALAMVGRASWGEVPPSYEKAVVASDGTRVTVRFEHEVLYDADVREDFARPAFITVGPNGTVFVSDFGDKRFRILDASGASLQAVGRRGEGPGEFQDAWVIATPSSGTRVFVWDRVGGFLNVFTAHGQFLHRAAVPSEFGLADPRSLYAEDDTTLVLGAVMPSRVNDGMAVHIMDLVPTGDRVELHVRDSFAATPAVWPYVYRFVAGGTATRDLDGGVLYAQGSPFALIKFTRDGRELWRVEEDDEFPHWSEFFRVGPTGATDARLYDYVRGVWPVGEGVYLVQILVAVPGYDEPGYDGPAYRPRYKLMWIEGGVVTRAADFSGPQDMEVNAQDNVGRLYIIWKSDSITRTTFQWAVGN